MCVKGMRYAYFRRRAKGREVVLQPVEVGRRHDREHAAQVDEGRVAADV